MSALLQWVIVSWALLLPPFWVANAQVIPNAKEWGEQFNTPGAKLSASENRRTQVEGRTTVYYTFSASGLPKGNEYTLWYWAVGGQPQAAAPAYISASGELMNNPPDAKHPSAAKPVEFAALGGRGEPKRLALMSKDGHYKVFQEVVPFPIEAHDNSCTLSVVMAAPRYYAVTVRGSGFQPDEQVMVDTQSENEKMQRDNKADDHGSFAAVIFPFVNGRLSGNTAFTATGVACKVIVSFPWGQGSYQGQ